MQKDKQEFAERLRAAMVRAGYEARPSVLEREFNLRHWGKPMTLHGVRRWLQGEVIPDYKKLQTLAQWLKVSVPELAEGRALAAKTRTDSWVLGLTYQDRELFELFLRLPVAKRKTAREVVLALAQADAFLSHSSGEQGGDF
jgi:transcriptional regulator with XRE-family HTH domain